LLKLEITNDVCRVKSAQTVSTHDILVFYRGVVISFYSLLTFQTAANLLKLA